MAGEKENTKLLELHKITAAESYIEKIEEESYVTLSSLPRNDDAPLSFHIPSVRDAFVDVSRIYLKIRIRILEAPGNVITAGKSETVGCINFLACTIWKNLEIFYENVLVYDAQNNYAHLYYLATLLHADDIAKSTYLTNALYFPDTAGN